MGDIAEVTSQIRYQLSQLGAKNAHHEFENLCRDLARSRICSNILPATGPVASGGDQGRDFETFAAHLREIKIVGSTFAGRASEEPIAFACTLQKKRISAKVKDDVGTVCSGGVMPTEVHYFCEVNVPVATRHDLQSAVHDEHGIHLEIYDGEAIAELLAGRDVFWIAMQYLSIPADIYPLPGDFPQWYTESRNSLQENLDSRSFADFLMLKTAIRYATFNEVAKTDLPGWIDLMRRLGESPIERIARSAVYEIAVARLRGMGSMEGEEEAIRGYFAKIPELVAYPELQDAACLLGYCFGAHHEGATTIGIDEVDGWRSTLKKRLSNLLRGEKSPNRKCELLFVSGYITLSGGQGKGNQNIKLALKDWLKLLRIVKQAPLFPLEALADVQTVFVPILVDNPDFVALTEATDQALAARHGQFVAAEKCRARAMALNKKHRILAAINELHRAKKKWFAEETLQGSILAILLISKWYLELGLAFASKQYGLAVASLALHANKDNVKRYVPAGIATAASSDYYLGAWCSFVILLESHLLTHNAFSPQAGEIDQHREFSAAIAHLVTVLAIAERTSPELRLEVMEKTKDWGLDDYIKALVPEHAHRMASRGEAALVGDMQQELGGVAFADAGPFRRVTWRQLGVTWTAEWRNDYPTTVAAEGFLAAFQVLLADLAGVDLCILRTTVNMRLDVEAYEEPRLTPQPSNDGRGWLVELPETVSREQQDLLDQEPWIVAAVSEILLEVSVVSVKRFKEVLHERFAAGLTGKMMVGRPYSVLYREFVEEDQFQSIKRDSPLPFSWDDWAPREDEELRWVGGSGPGYSEERSREVLLRRYKWALKAVRQTLPRLLQEDGFRETVRRLRDNGWLDWQIVTAIASTAANYRVSCDPRSLEDPSYSQELLKMFSEGEADGFPKVPVAEFNEDALEEVRQVSLLASLKGLGLELRQRTPDFPAIEDFLAERYGYWTDDVDHEDPFA